MTLESLIYGECFVDSPRFRGILAQYEKELEENSAAIKTLVKECRKMMKANEEFSKAQEEFASSLRNFYFNTTKEREKDKILIVGIEDSRRRMIKTIPERLIESLEMFSNDKVKKAKAEKKIFNQESHTYYASLEQQLCKKKEEDRIAEFDDNLRTKTKEFHGFIFEYVSKLQDVHSQKIFDLVEPIIGYIDDISSFFHEAHDASISIKEKEEVQLAVQNLRETYENEQKEKLKFEVQTRKQNELDLKNHQGYFKQGHLFIQHSRMSLYPTWHRYFCKFRKEVKSDGTKVKEAQFTPIGHPGQISSRDFVEVKKCIGMSSEEGDRWFCFNIVVATPQGNQCYTCQAINNDDWNEWLEVMDEEGLVSIHLVGNGPPDMEGYNFIFQCIKVIEHRGLEEKELYKKSGRIVIANKLLKDCLKEGKLQEIDFSDNSHLDTITIASAMKRYFSQYLAEPILTYEFYGKFIEAGKIRKNSTRLVKIEDILSKLPKENINILYAFIQHLKHVAYQCQVNKMNANDLANEFESIFLEPVRSGESRIRRIIVKDMIINTDTVIGSTLRSAASELNQTQPAQIEPCTDEPLATDSKQFTPSNESVDLSAHEALADISQSHPDSSFARVNSDITLYIGEEKGIQGHQNSCYMDSTIFGIFALTDKFDAIFQEDKKSPLGNVLWMKIINPLRMHVAVKCEAIMELEREIGKSSTFSCNRKDPVEFLKSMCTIYFVTPFFSIRCPSGITSDYFVNIVNSYELAKLGTIINEMFKEQKLSFTKMPSKILIEVSKDSMQKVIPDIELDISAVTDSVHTGICFLCEDQKATLICDGCYEEFNSSHKVMAYCDECHQRTHKHSRSKHDSRPCEEGHSTLSLTSVLCVKDDHYVCFSQHGNHWLFFDSMYNRVSVNEQRIIPMIKDCSNDLNEWVYSKDYGTGNLEQLNSQDLPDIVRQFTQDIYLCIYTHKDY